MRNKADFLKNSVFVIKFFVTLEFSTTYMSHLSIFSLIFSNFVRIVSRMYWSFLKMALMYLSLMKRCIIYKKKRGRSPFSLSVSSPLSTSYFLLSTNH